MTERLCVVVIDAVEGVKFTLGVASIVNVTVPDWLAARLMSPG
jgi:hypothetical protein